MLPEHYTLTPLRDTLPSMALCAWPEHKLLAAGNGKLVIYDVSTPTHPRALGELSGIDGARQIAISGHFALITAREKGIWVVDISAPGQPQLVCRQETVELATGIVASGDLVYVAQRLYGVEVMRLQPDGHLVHLFRTITDEAQSVISTADGCLVGDWKSGKLTRLRLNSTGKLAHAGHAPLSGYGDGLDMVGDLVYVTTGHHSLKMPPETRLGHGHGLEIYRLPPQGAPMKLGAVGFPYWPEVMNDFWTVRCDGKTAFCADTHNGFHLVDVTDPAQPRLLNSWRLPEQTFGQKTLPDCVTSVALVHGAAFVSGLKTGLWLCNAPVQDIRKAQPAPSRPLRLPRPASSLAHYQRYFAGHDIRQLQLVDDTIWLAAAHDGLLRLSGARTCQPKLEQTLPLGCVHDVYYHQGRLYVARDLTTLDIFELQACDQLKHLATFSHPAVAIRQVHISQDGRFALVSGGTGCSHILDISQLDNIRLAHNHCPGGIQYGDGFPEHDLDGLIPQNWHYTGIAWYDLRGEQPTLLRHDRTPKIADQIDGIGLFRQQFLLAGWGKGYYLGDSNGFTCHSVPGHQPHGIPSWDGDKTVIFSCRRNGTIQAYDFSDSAHAHFIPQRSLNLNGTPGRVHFNHAKRAFIPAGHDGLLVEKE